MPHSILQQLFPRIPETLQTLLTRPIAVVVVGLGLMSLLYRHCLLCYGSRKAPLLPLLLFGLIILSLPEVTMAKMSAIPMISAALVVLFVELLVISYARQNSPFISFNSGVTIATLSLFHPGYLALLLIQLQKAERLKVNTPRHLSALTLGLVTTLLVALMLSAPPEWTALRSTMLGYISSLRVTLTLPMLPITSMLGVGIIVPALSAQGYFTQRRSTSRYRWMLLLHLLMMWVLLILYALYSTQSGYLISALFFGSSACHYLITDSGSSPALKWALLAGVLLCMIGAFSTISQP